MHEFNAHFDGKHLVPDEPVDFPKNTLIRVKANVVGKAKKKKGNFVIGRNPVRLGISDLSENLDKYLYRNLDD